MAKRRRNTMDLAAGLGLASLHTGITLFYRLPMSLRPPSLPHATAQRHRCELANLL